MRGPLTPHDDLLHHALLRQVREALDAGSPLPGEFELIARLHCTRQRLRRALAELENAGIIHRRQGAPTTVDPVGLRMSVRLEDQFEHTELLARLGYRATVEILESAPRPLPAKIATILGAAPGTPALRTRKRWLADDRPVMLAFGYMVMPDLEPRTLHESVFTAVTQVWGEQLIWEVATPGAAVVEGADAVDLGRAAGSPVMTLELIGVAASGRRLLYAFEHHDPEIVRYSFVRTVRPPWNPA